MLLFKNLQRFPHHCTWVNSRVLTLPYKPLLNFPSVSPTASCPLALSTLDIFLFLKHASLTFIPTFLDLPSSYNTFSRVSLGWFLLVIPSTEAQMCLICLGKSSVDHCGWRRVSNGKKGEIKTELRSVATLIGT